MAGGSRRAGLTIQTAFFLSGAAGLGYEVVWTRQFGVGLGHEYVAVLAVVSAFFGGVALGAWAGDRRIAASRQPGRIYALLELAIGLWAAASLVLVPRANDLANGLLGLEPSAAAHWAVAFALPFLTLLPATAAMGATLPAIERLTARLRGDGQRVAGLYALNTVGAAAGILASHTLLLPNLGLQASILALAGVNLACAGLVWFGSARGEEEREEVEITRLGGVEAHKVWIRNMFVLDLERKAAFMSLFDGTARIAASVPTYQLEYPRDYASLENVRNEILSAVGEDAHVH